jgi:hypothetical protein
MPFAGYTDFNDCTRRNRDKDNPDAYCGSIKRDTEDKMKKARGEVIRAGKAAKGAVRLKRKAVVEPRDLLGAVKKAVAESSGKHVGDGDPYGVDKAVDKVIKRLQKHDAPGHPSGATVRIGAHGQKLDSVPHSVAHTRESFGMPERTQKALSGPVAEKGDKKLTGDEGEGAQADQAFAVAHGPDNYDALVKKAADMRYSTLMKSMGDLKHDLVMKRYLARRGLR